MSLSFFFFLHYLYSSRLSLLPSFYSLSSLSPLISRRQVGGGDDSEAEMEQLESGGLVCLSLTLSSPDCSFIPMPSSTHWSPLHFVDSRPSHPLSTTTVPSKLVLGRWIRGEPHDESTRIYYDRRSGEALFFHEKFSVSLIMLRAHTKNKERRE